MARQNSLARPTRRVSDRPYHTMKQSRIAITGLGLTAPNGNTLAEYRQNLLTGVSGV